MGRTESNQSGGIGAALSHYTVSHDGQPLSSEVLSNQMRVLNQNEVVSSSRSLRMNDGTGGFTVRTSKRSEMGARGISPLLLPPPGLPSATMDPPDLVRPEDRHLSARLLPRDYKAGSVRDGSSRSLNTGYAGRGLPNHLLSGELFIDPVRRKKEQKSAELLG